MTAPNNYREAIVGIATELVGSPSIQYVSAQPELGLSPDDGFDCSGFVRFVLQEAGLHVPDFTGLDEVERPVRHADEFWNSYGVYVHDGLQKPGDLVFFSKLGILPTHIGIMRDPESYVHAPGKNGTVVEVKPLKRNEIEPLTVTPERPRRQLYRVNPIGFKAPTVVKKHPSPRYHQKAL